MTVEAALRRILDANRMSRESASRRIARLSDAIQTGTIDEYNDTVAKLLRETYDNDSREGDDVLGQDGSAEPVVGSEGDGELGT